MFEPAAIAVIGASNRTTSVGMRVYKNLLYGGYNGQLYAVNPKHKNVQGQPCFSSVDDINEAIDLAVITTPANTVPHIITQCGKKNIHNAIIISAGFSETGEVGKKLEQHLLNIAQGYHIRLIGPNCLGVMRPQIKMNATFDSTMISPGNLAFISQSGALSAAILDWAVDKKIGFSAIASLGNSVDVDFADVLDYLTVDPNTQSILLYIEGIHHSRRFMSALRAAARMKPVIAIKAGRLPLGSRAALSHTGALIGDDDVFNEALRRAGAVRVMTIEELFLAAEVLSSNYRAKGNRLIIITNGGGAGVMAADRAADLQIDLPKLSEECIKQLDQVLPAQWSHQNPIDIIGDATPERYHQTLSICAKTDEVDGILAILVPVAMVQPLKVAEQIVTDVKQSDKPILACWMGEKQVRSSWNLFSENQVPCFDTPEKAIQAFSYLAEYHLNQQLLLQVPEPLSPQPKPDIVAARLIIDTALAEQRTQLTSVETRAILKAFAIPVTDIRFASTKEEAVDAAIALGFPVVMKINSPDISHKSDVGGVLLNINNQESVMDAFDKILKNAKDAKTDAKILGVMIEPMISQPNDREVLIGVVRDVVFGPVLSFGAGGTLVEIMRDRAIALPPLNQFIANQLIQRTRIAKLLGKFRNMPAVNMGMIINILLRVSEMACELPDIMEMDINPLIVNDQTALVVDARIILKAVAKRIPQYSHMAIHPYPNDLIESHILKNGTPIIIRPIRPEDANITQEFVRNLSPQSKYFRFLQHIRELAPGALVRLTQIDYDREMTFVATSEKNGNEIFIGVAHYITNPDRESAEFAIVVADEWQHKGVGSKLMHCLINEAKAQALCSLIGVVLATNAGMLEMVQHLGFSISGSDDPTIRIVTNYI